MSTQEYRKILKNFTQADRTIINNQYGELFARNTRGAHLIKNDNNPRRIDHENKKIILESLRAKNIYRTDDIAEDVYTYPRQYRNIPGLINILNRYQNVFLRIESLIETDEGEQVKETLINRTGRNIRYKYWISIAYKILFNSDNLPDRITIRVYDKIVSNKIAKIAGGVQYDNIELYQGFLLSQIFKNNNNNTCFYDCIIKKIDSMIKDDNTNKLNKAYMLLKNKVLELKDEEGMIINSDKFNKILNMGISIEIYNLITRESTLYKSDVRREINVSMVFTHDNHLEYYNNETEIINISKFEELKETNNEYVNVNNKLYIAGNTYEREKLNEEYYEEYKNYFAQINNDNINIVNYLNNYCYNMHHTFLNTTNKQSPLDLDGDMCIDYAYDTSKINKSDIIQYDIKKAFYNVCNMPFYHGIPSKNLILHKLINFTYEDFKKQFDNSIIGFYTIKIKKVNDKRLLKFGFNAGQVYIQASIMIEFLIKYCDIEFLYGLYSKTDKTPLYTEKHLETVKTKDNKDIEKYKKYNGLLLASNTEHKIIIKSEKMTDEFINYCKHNEYSIYYNKVGNIKEYVLIKPKEKFVYSGFASLYIHSYINYKILNTVFKMKDINNLYMIKLDCILCHKSEKTIFDKYFKDDTSKMTKSLDEIFNIGSYGVDMFVPVDIDYINSLNIKEISLGEDKINYLYKNIIFCNGKGGSGKTFNICNTFNNILYVSHCWDLCEQMKKDYKNIKLSVTPTRIIERERDKHYDCEKIDVSFYDVVIIDELTLLYDDIINDIIKKCNNKFIFLIGDIDVVEKFNFQVGITDIPYKFNPKAHQLITYKKSFRFDDNLNNKLDILREKMIEFIDNKDRDNIIKNITKELFKDRLFNYKDVVYDKNTFGLVSVNELTNGNLNKYYNNKPTLTKYYSEKDNITKNYVYQTNYKQGIYKGRYEKEPKAYTKNLLFNSVHSFQGKTINKDDKLIFDISKITNYQIFYTGLSRVKTENQIYLIEYID